METRFDHRAIEEKIYKKWEKSGFFNPDNCIKKGITKKTAKKFSMVLPPPNVTGMLHIGHAARLTTEDIMVRCARMKGKRTLWIPGTDHAAIATQSKVEKIIYKEEGKTRYDLGRKNFLKRVEQFAEESHNNIVNQVKRMGSTVDWSREAYTLDKERSFAVRTAFKKMYDTGLIYRGHRIINWDPKGQTTISDDEIIYKEITGKLYTFRYSKDFPISIATTRPETKIGDTAVAVHPDDVRYKKYIGKEYDIDFVGIPLHIKIVADKEIDKDFGTGAVGVTPAHSMVDWEIAQRHNLAVAQVIDEKARMIIDDPELNGIKTKEAREVIIKRLEKQGLLEKEEEISQNISTAERTGGIIEPLPKLQWFIAVNKKFVLKKSNIKGIKSGQETTLKKVMQAAVKNGQIKIIPKRFEKIYFQWINNLHDWCISRQIWFGHRIPVWYCKKCEKVIVSVDDTNKCPKCNGKVEQDPDTLDTWFSSGLWTFSTLGWPKKTKDFKNYHPTDMLETAYDILFFWVARMILMTGFLLGDIPFHNVYLHGLVRDDKGRKMSKSLGNIINPLDMIEKYGADATRLSLVIGEAPGNDTKLSEDKIRGYRNFTTKIWNASRFVIMNYKKTKVKPKYTAEDKRHLKEIKDIKKKVDKYLDKFDLNHAADILYHYFWHTFADKIIESAKPRLYGDDEVSKAAAQEKLLIILSESMKMLHPFTPFVTEEVWSRLPKHHGRKSVKKNLLLIEKW